MSSFLNLSLSLSLSFPPSVPLFVPLPLSPPSLPPFHSVVLSDFDLLCRYDDGEWWSRGSWKLTQYPTVTVETEEHF